MDKLAPLWAEYRSSLPDPDASPEFMPKLWKRIEARRQETTSVFRRLAQVCVGATAVLLLLLSTLAPAVQDDVYYSSTYADVLAADHADNDLVQALPADLPGDGR
jgi:hypothetical protein